MIRAKNPVPEIFWPLQRLELFYCEEFATLYQILRGECEREDLECLDVDGNVKDDFQGVDGGVVMIRELHAPILDEFINDTV